ncbi:MAG: hypothetical protein IT445_05420 [Phycisphaeraceae bacterium]|nr:hypothetical protein [Phycisphaeraceae bacterium]
MSPLQHAMLGYAAAAVCLWGYALWIWLAGYSSRAARRQQHNEVKP